MEKTTVSGKVNPVVLDQMISVLILSSNYPHPESLSISPNSDGKYSYTFPLTINDVSSANFTVIAQYAGAKTQTTFSYTGLPCNQQSIPAYVYSAPIIRGPPAYNPRLLDSSGNAIVGPVKVGQQIQITYTLANGFNCAQPFAYLVQIQDLNGKTVSLSWIAGTLLAGQSLNPAQSWTPQYNGTYTAQIFTWQSIDNPNALAPPVSYTIDAEPNSNLTISSQVVTRIASNCNEGFTHIIKKGDGSPACVTPQTAQKLVVRGWAKALSTVKSGLNSKEIVGIDSIQMIPPYNPGGPTIQLTLKNISIKPITSLKAILELYNNYTFDFKDVTSSTLLYSGNSTTDTETLIGGGFQSEIPYAIMISGIVNGVPFNFTETVHIPFTNENNPVQNNSSTILPLQSNEITTLENSTGLVTLENHTYYFDTPNYTGAAYTNPVQMSFHDVFFTLFPSRFAGGLPENGCGGKYYWANAEFPDGIRELLQIFVDSQSCDSRSMPIVLSTHTIPQAGLTYYDGKMKLLVSVKTLVGKNIVLEKTSSDAKPFPICNANPTKERLVREKQRVLEDVLTAEEAKHGGFENRTQNLPWSGIGYDCVDNALEVNILPQYFNADLLPKYFEKIRSIVGDLIDIVLSPQGYATPL